MYNTAMIEKTVAGILRHKHLTLAVAESCTGGLIASRLTDIPGSSDYFLAGIVAYANEAKIGVLGIDRETIRKFGAVSRQTAMAMAQNVRHLFGAHIGLAVTGIAGPSGGSTAKPVGTVFISVSLGHRTYFKKYQFNGNRLKIKKLAKNAALELLKECLS
ncbi:MAG: nicotinamide-nucleotide amidohydrolase family protein [Candidatus Omnitrophica bacterium]|nr:nicotinamide-nucleotide amidohydrolase family protein [Candidatus Omnitrophota bacterium]MDD5137269.1 nicotinamide-nucleotide amidohydrolase family protein [Candidatus Omnitrophota bacterium]MDD5537970.1 nicotinamide-nucleotide amidohydrolase family protein [Candidatus Omnitrophota bacterium]